MLDEPPEEDSQILRDEVWKAEIERLREPLNAEEELKERANAALKDKKGFIFCFFDETAL